MAFPDHMRVSPLAKCMKSYKIVNKVIKTKSGDIIMGPEIFSYAPGIRREKNGCNKRRA